MSETKAQASDNKDFLLKPAPGSIKRRKRVGRGPGSGHGGTSCRGMNGQKSRSGWTHRAWFEGGQMPLARRVPKRGFTNIFRKQFEIVGLASLERFEAGAVVDPQALYEKGLISSKTVFVKLLANGALTRKLAVRIHAASKTALEKITAAGGTLEIIPEVGRRPKGVKKAAEKE
jgi:large subunit ribosomal protein L15